MQFMLSNNDNVYYFIDNIYKFENRDGGVKLVIGNFIINITTDKNDNSLPRVYCPEHEFTFINANLNTKFYGMRQISRDILYSGDWEESGSTDYKYTYEFNFKRID